MSCNSTLDDVRYKLSGCCHYACSSCADLFKDNGVVATAIGPSKVTTGISDLSGSGDTCVGSSEQRFLMLKIGFKFVNCFGHSVQSEVRRFQSMIEAQGR